jgi:HAD superfamily hydrolase (TIGR01484 family)
MRLLSLDFDGTLIDKWNGRSTPAPAPELIELLRRLKNQGVLFALNTGRTLELVNLALESFPILPDFALTSEREIYRREGGHWIGLKDWNQSCEEAHIVLYEKTRSELREIASYVKTETAGRMMMVNDRIEGVVATDSKEMDRIQALIDGLKIPNSAFSYQRNDIYLRFCHVDYDKGSVLAELEKRMGITPEETFAAGDNYNDLPMLNPAVARWLACPSNSIVQVKEQVAKYEGLVAQQESGLGIVEALTSFFPELT